jgi:serine/threonine protein kinase
LSVILRIVQGIAAAAAHLHARGILHGDLYAHNILVNPLGDSLLGDFGAASFYPSSLPAIAQSLEWIEVRAFGCLLEDLLDRCTLDGSQSQTELRERLDCLQQDCMSPVPSQRPPFAKICDVLAG